MNKGDLVEAVAEHMGENKQTAARAVDAVLRSLVEGVSHDEKVTIAGFGTFRKKLRKSRRSINPSTREEMIIPASTTVSFTPSQALRDTLKEREPAAAAE